jgi:hypothetical protein
MSLILCHHQWMCCKRSYDNDILSYDLSKSVWKLSSCAQENNQVLKDGRSLVAKRASGGPPGGPVICTAAEVHRGVAVTVIVRPRGFCGRCIHSFLRAATIEHLEITVNA